uniref:Neogenin_C domain-containing protein n=1 Tax=Macrostomum lignano TaxID=282301 RepID=A0A1I8IQV2_9PLAT
ILKSLSVYGGPSHGDPEAVDLSKTLVSVINMLSGHHVAPTLPAPHLHQRRIQHHMMQQQQQQQPFQPHTPLTYQQMQLGPSHHTMGPSSPHNSSYVYPTMSSVNSSNRSILHTAGSVAAAASHPMPPQPSPGAEPAYPAVPQASSSASVVVKVLPDKKLISKASSSENLGPGSSSAAASDLNNLTSLVLRKRDRSQDSADSSNGGSPPRRPARVRKAPAPPPPPPTSTTSTASLTSAAFVDGTASAADDASIIAVASARKMKPPSGRPRPLPSEESSEPEESRSRDSPVDEGSAAALGHHRSSSFEFLQDAVQSRTAPKIRQPSAIRKISDSNPAPQHPRDASPCKATPYGSSPPKTVSFNPTDEILTYDGAPSRKSHHRQGQSSRNQLSKLGDNALIDVHGTMVEMMERIVSNQRQLLSQVREGSISVASYREDTKSLLTMQTRTIQKILDTIQANERDS